MHGPCSIPHITPRLTVCPNGCVHLQIGPAIVLMSAHTLRALGELVRDAVGQLPPEPRSAAMGSSN